MNSFDAKINTENLTKCLQTLKQFYGDLYKDKVKDIAIKIILSFLAVISEVLVKWKVNTMSINF